MRLTLGVLTVFCCCVAQAALVVETVYTPAEPGGQYKHPASITELDNGDLMIAFYGGSGEYEDDSKGWAGRLKKGETKWSAPQVIADTPLRSDGNMVIWQGPEGRVWLFYVCRYGETWSESRVKFRISEDGAQTWSDPDILLCEFGSMVQGVPLLLNDGHFLLPVYHEVGHDRELVGADSTSYFLKIDPKTGTFETTGHIRSKRGSIQAVAAQLTDKDLLAFTRRGGGYGLGSDGYVIRSESHDGGMTWSEGVDSEFPNPNAAVAFLKLQSGNLLLIYNDSKYERTPLIAAISTDGGKTFEHRAKIMDGYNAFAYPYAIEGNDGTIHLVFTSDGRSRVHHATFDESDVLDATMKHVLMPQLATEPSAGADERIGAVNSRVYYEKTRFGGWPANHGIWSWGNEILVGFSRGWYKDLGPDRHAIDREKPEEHLLARSLDGGETWAIENPAEKGDLIPMGVGKGLHGLELPGVKIPDLQDCPGGIDFTHPDFAMTLRMSDVDAGESRFYYSYDRGHNWEGPFRLPNFDTKGIAARTDYVVNGKHDCMLFLTAAKSDGKEGRVLAARTQDGGKTWNFLSFIGPEPKGYSIMPATVRVSESKLVTILREREGDPSWTTAYASNDNGMSWEYLNKPSDSTGEGNPAALIKLADGRLCYAYGYRAEPWKICAKLSSDEGKSWSDEIILRADGANRDIGYPRIVQRPDGKVVTIYYFSDLSTGPERYIGATIWDPAGIK